MLRGWRGRRARWLWIGLGAPCGVLVLAAAWLLPPVLGVATGFFAKQLCSGVFVSRRVAERVVGDDLHAYRPQLLSRLIDWSVDEQARRVSASWLGLKTSRASFKPESGCTIETHAATASAATGRPSATASSAGVPSDDRMWPQGTRVDVAAARAGFDAPALDRAVLDAFLETRDEPTTRTRAVVVVYRGRIVAERYASGFGPDVALPGWSMGKSVINALAGALAREGIVALDAPLDAPREPRDALWPAGDARRAITVEHALRMQSGLAFDERYVNPLSDVTRMLFTAGDVAAFAASKSLAHAPGSHWAYASGTTNVLVRMLLARLPESEREGAIEREVFAPLGMGSALMERDAAGTPVGSSFVYATARDWARFGLLYAQDGVWAGRRLLPEGWVALTRRATAGSEGRYGAHFWLLPPGKDAGEAPPLPEDVFEAAGHGGQFVTIVPSRRVVVVRLGLTLGREGWSQRHFVARVLAAIAAPERALAEASATNGSAL